MLLVSLRYGRTFLIWACWYCDIWEFCFFITIICEDVSYASTQEPYSPDSQLTQLNIPQSSQRGEFSSKYLQVKALQAK